MKNTKELLTKAAAKLFLRQGYNGTGLSEILNECHVQKGSLYHFFPGGKEELGIAAINYIRDESVQRIRSHLEKTGDAKAAFRNLFILTGESMLKRSEFNPYRISLILLEAGPTSRALEAPCSETYRACGSLFAEKLQACGYSPKDSTRIGHLILVLIDGIAVHCLSENSMEPAYAAADTLDLVLDTAREKSDGKLF